MKIQEMEYKESQYFNTNVQTRPLLTKEDINYIFHQVVDKEGDSGISYIKIFHNAKYLEISVGNSYNVDQLIHTFLDKLQKGGKYSD